MVTAPPAVDTAGTVALSDTTPRPGGAVTATLTDPDTPTALTYQWQYRFDASESWVDTGAIGATTATLTVPPGSSVGGQYRVVISYTDNFGSQTATSGPAVVTAPPAVDTAGTVALSDTTPRPGGAVTATLTDPDNPTALTYQWQWRATSSGSWADSSAPGATGRAFTVPAGDPPGGQYRVVISYTDDFGSQTATSGPATVTAPPAATGSITEVWVSGLRMVGVVGGKTRILRTIGRRSTATVHLSQRRNNLFAANPFWNSGEVEIWRGVDPTGARTAAGRPSGHGELAFTGLLTRVTQSAPSRTPARMFTVQAADHMATLENRVTRAALHVPEGGTILAAVDAVLGAAPAGMGMTRGVVSAGSLPDCVELDWQAHTEVGRMVRDVASTGRSFVAVNPDRTVDVLSADAPPLESGYYRTVDVVDAELQESADGLATAVFMSSSDDTITPATETVSNPTTYIVERAETDRSAIDADALVKAASDYLLRAKLQRTLAFFLSRPTATPPKVGRRYHVVLPLLGIGTAGPPEVAQAWIVASVSSSALEGPAGHWKHEVRMVEQVEPGNAAFWRQVNQDKRETLSVSFAGCDAPTFNAVTVADQSWVHNTAIVDVILPAATGGDGTLTYSVSGLPAGLAFTAATRTISGAATTVANGTVTYTVTDSDGDVATLTFDWSVASLRPSTPTGIAIRNVGSGYFRITWTPSTSGNNAPMFYDYLEDDSIISGRFAQTWLDTNKPFGTKFNIRATQVIDGVRRNSAWSVSVYV